MNKACSLLWNDPSVPLYYRVSTGEFAHGPRCEASDSGVDGGQARSDVKKSRVLVLDAGRSRRSPAGPGAARRAPLARPPRLPPQAKTVPDVVLETDEYVEVVRAGHGAAAAIFTCEHASRRLPEPWRWPAEDEWLAGTHWAYDLGAAELATELATRFATVAVLSRFSRLLADPNRPESDAELFRTTAEGRTIQLNTNLDAGERERRLDAWRAYHLAADREVARSTAPVVLAVHTFTPVYDGSPRAVEVGVLFDDETALAERLRDAVHAAGFRVAMNEPYSGKLGLMYSVDRHARRHSRHALELEFRQDLAVDGVARARLVSAVSDFFRGL